MENCRDPLAPSDEELLRIVYEEAELPQAKHEHLEQCSICQQRLASYEHTQARLLSKLYRSICPSAVDLNYYCLGMLPAEKRTNIASHLLDCPRCADEVQEIRKEQAAYDLFPAQGSARLATAVRRIFAQLAVQQALPVTRNAPAVRGWPRQYHSETIDLSLHLSRATNGEHLLLGLVTSTNPAQTLDTFEGQTVELYPVQEPVSAENQEETAPLLSTEIDEVGNIYFEGVPAGEYVMIVRLTDREVVIEGIIIDA